MYWHDITETPSTTVEYRRPAVGKCEPGVFQWLRLDTFEE